MSQFNSTASLNEYLRGIVSRVSALERTKVTHGAGPPSTGFTEPYVDDTNSRVYFYVAGVAKSAALT